LDMDSLLPRLGSSLKVCGRVKFNYSDVAGM
jgi:hypothetical protein